MSLPCPKCRVLFSSFECPDEECGNYKPPKALDCPPLVDVGEEPPQGGPNPFKGLYELELEPGFWVKIRPSGTFILVELLRPGCFPRHYACFNPDGTSEVLVANTAVGKANIVPGPKWGVHGGLTLLKDSSARALYPWSVFVCEGPGMGFFVAFRSDGTTEVRVPGILYGVDTGPSLNWK